MTYDTRTTEISMSLKDKQIFDESVIKIRIEDEAAGEFLVIESLAEGYGKIAIDPDEWPTLRRAINRMVKQCRTHDAP